MSEIDDLGKEYLLHAHAMQAGVAMTMNYDGSETTPKHLRVGINTAMSDHGALVKLLIDKGIITELEYMTVLRDFMKSEAQGYEKKLSERLGTTIHLV